MNADTKFNIFKWFAGILICVLFYIAIGNELIYYNTSKLSDYTIEIEMLDGKIDTISTRLPYNIIFQLNENINTHNKSKDYHNLDYLMPRQLLFGGHWMILKKDVKNYRLLYKIDIK